MTPSGVLLSEFVHRFLHICPGGEPPIITRTCPGMLLGEKMPPRKAAWPAGGPLHVADLASFFQDQLKGTQLLGFF
jgi:hypothetical protein